MEITEQSEDEYHFKTLDGNFSGVVLYDTLDGTFYIDDCVHIYDKEFGTKGWEYSIGDDEVYSI
jgi:hypothetical protein